jgi:hypothetical protein
MHKTPNIRDGQRRCIESKDKEAHALKEREELVTIIGGVS